MLGAWKNEEFVAFLKSVWTELDFGDGTLFKETVKESATKWRKVADWYARNYCPSQEVLERLGTPVNAQEYLKFIEDPLRNIQSLTGP